MKIAVGCDPNAQAYKEEMIEYIKSLGHEVTDFGSDDVIYAHVATKVAEAVAAKEYDRGVLFCGTGIGVMLAANKVKGVRCALCSEPYSAEMTRRHNDANCLAMGALMIGSMMAERIVDVFLTTEFEGGRHQRRVDKVMATEQK